MNASIPAITVKSVAKRFGSFTALEKVSLEIRQNEFFTLLGPSGCGKTTLLRLIGGFETASEGEILLHGEEIENLPANKRSVNTVFQQYALFPHMTVSENIAFGMKMKKVAPADIQKRTADALEMVQLSDFSHRKPHQLSGGQKQRVALARALAPQPKVLLLDEPLSALDLKLRQSMRVELKAIQQHTGITFVFVTHDQEEALTMSDRIAVMSAGKLQQVGTARDIYENPKNMLVADFIGETNFLDATALTIVGKVALCALSDGTKITCDVVSETSSGIAGKISIRPERLKLESSQKHGIQAIVSTMIYIGSDTQYIVKTPDGKNLIVRVQNATGFTPQFACGDNVSVVVDQSAARFLAS